MRAISALAVGAVLVTGCQPAAKTVSPAQCPAWRNIDFSKLSEHQNGDPNAPLWEDVWKNWANAETGIVWGADRPTSVVHFITYPGGLTIDPVVREVVGRQTEAGWRIYARSSSGHAPRPQWTEWRSIRLTTDGERRLNSILADPCLWAAPRFLDSEVRLLNGRGDSRPDGPSTGNDLTKGDRHWGGWHFSWLVGPQGQLSALLLGEAFGLPEWVDEDIGPEGWFDWPFS